MISGMTSRPAGWLFLRAVFPAAIAALFTNGHGVVAAAAAADNHFPNDRDGKSMITINNDGRQLLEEDAMDNWDLTYVGFTADLNYNSVDEFVMDFEIGKDRVVETRLLAKGCENDITGIDIVESQSRKSANETHELLRVGYSIDKALITASNLWSDTAALNQLEFCHLIQLVYPASETNPKFIISEMKTEFVVDVDLSVDFALNQTLKGDGPYLVMIIAGNLTIGDVGPNPSTGDIEWMESVYDQAIEEIVSKGLGKGRSMTNMTVLGLNQELANSYIEFELTLEEACANITACEALVDTTTMYEDVTENMVAQIDNGVMTTTLQSVSMAIEYSGRYLVEHGATTPDSHHRKLQTPNMPEVTGGAFADPIIFVEFPPGPFIGSVSGDTDLISYVEACKCDGAQSFTCNTDTLVSSTELSFCIRSVSPDVEIDFLDSMIISQGSTTTLNFIEDSTILNPSITSWEFVPGSNGIAVSTRVPINTFSFAQGEFVTISGVVVVKLAGGGRKLLVVTSDSVFDENASFRLKVDMSDNSAAAEYVSNNSAAADTNKGFVVVGMILSFVYTMFW